MSIIDTKLVPKRILASGEEIPAIGMGTFGSDRFSAEQVSSAVLGAAQTATKSSLSVPTRRKAPSKCATR